MIESIIILDDATQKRGSRPNTAKIGFPSGFSGDSDRRLTNPRATTRSRRRTKTFEPRRPEGMENERKESEQRFAQGQMKPYNY